MSLEAAIEKLTAAVEANVDLLKQVLAADEAKGGDAGSTEKKTRTTKAKSDDTKTETKTETSGATTVPAELKAALGTWLGEFAKEADKENPDGAHPEVKGRKAALKKAFEGLGVKNLTEITTAEGVTKLTNWFEKAKAVDKGFGIGRFAADPEPAGSGDDDLEV